MKGLQSPRLERQPQPRKSLWLHRLLLVHHSAWRAAISSWAREE